MRIMSQNAIKSTPSPPRGDEVLGYYDRLESLVQVTTD